MTVRPPADRNRGFSSRTGRLSVPRGGDTTRTRIERFPDAENAATLLLKGTGGNREMSESERDSPGSSSTVGIPARRVAALMEVSGLLHLAAHEPGSFPLALARLREVAGGLRPRHLAHLSQVAALVAAREKRSRVGGSAAAPQMDGVPPGDVSHRLAALLEPDGGVWRGATEDERKAVRLVCEALAPSIRAALEERRALLGAGRPARPALPKGVILSGREEEVLDGILAGRTRDDIAARAGVSLETVRTYVARLYKKLGVGGREELLRRLLR